MAIANNHLDGVFGLDWFFKFILFIRYKSLFCLSKMYGDSGIGSPIHDQWYWSKLG